MGYVAFFDGCCEPRNPGGNAGYGVVIYKDGQRVWQHSGMMPASKATSCNVAEYLAFNAALDWFIANSLTKEPILIKGDSKLVIQQCFGRWRIKRGLYREYALEAKGKMLQFKALKGTWISRVYNSEADDLSKDHLRKAGIKFVIQPDDPEQSTDNWANALKP
jgi:ribonuclease HI